MSSENQTHILSGLEVDNNQLEWSIYVDLTGNLLAKRTHILSYNPYLLRWQDIKGMFEPCGRSKAMRIMKQVGITHRIGKTPYVHAEALRRYLIEHNNEVKVDWGK